MKARVVVWTSVVVLWAAGALADVRPVRRGPCEGRSAGAACIQPDGHAGVCTRDAGSDQLVCRARQAPDAGRRQ